MNYIQLAYKDIFKNLIIYLSLNFSVNSEEKYFFMPNRFNSNN